MRETWLPDDGMHFVRVFFLASLGFYKVKILSTGADFQLFLKMTTWVLAFFCDEQERAHRLLSSLPCSSSATDRPYLVHFLDHLLFQPGPGIIECEPLRLSGAVDGPLYKVQESPVQKQLFHR